MGWQTALKRWARKWYPWILLTVVMAGTWAVFKWRQHNHAADIREAEAAGFVWEERKDPIEAIIEDWHNAFRKETWESYRRLDHREVPDLTPYRSLIHRLDPTCLSLSGCKNVDVLKGLTDLQALNLQNCPALQNVDVLKGLTALQYLDLWDCPALQNVDVLKGLTALKSLYLRDCPALQNVDALRGLTALQQINLYGCPALRNLDGLKGLTGLQSLDLRDCPTLQNVDGLKGLTVLHSLNLKNCPALQNVDALKGLTALQWLWLTGSTGIPAAALRDIRAALLQTRITFPDGTKSPPP